MFMACMFEHTNSVSACRDEIVVLESCIAKLEANPVSEQQRGSQRGRQWQGRQAELRLTRRLVKMWWLGVAVIVYGGIVLLLHHIQDLTLMAYIRLCL